MSQQLYILDGYGFIYRGYFAFMNRPLINGKGQNVSAVFNFFRTIFSCFNRYGIENFIVTLDSLVPTFRHESFPAYKATRDKTPEELFEQIDIIEELLKLAGIYSIRKNRFEADDLMGTLSKRGTDSGFDVFLLSSDKDILQLVNEKSHVLKSDKTGWIELGPQGVYEERGVYPDQIIDYLALIGDSSDNIPGVKGIGPKTAIKLLADYKTLDGVYENIDKITSQGQRTKLLDNRDNAFLSKDLVTIKQDVEIDFNPDEYLLGPGDLNGILRRLDELELPTLINDFRKILIGDGDQIENKERVCEKSTAATCDIDYEIVNSPEALNSWIIKLKKNKIFSFDCETDNIDEMQASPVGFSFSMEPFTGCYIPIKSSDGLVLDESIVLKALKDLLEDSANKVVGQNIKYDYKVLKRWGVEIANLYFDTMVAGWILDAGLPSFSMDALAEKFLGYKPIPFSEIVEKGSTIDNSPLDQVARYAAEDADVTWRLFQFFSKKLEGNKLGGVFENIEMPLVKILAEMELTGIGCSSLKLGSLSERFGTELELIEDDIYTLCGHSFNINSPKQLQTVLFEERKLTPIKKTKTGYSTDISTLKRLAVEDPVPEKIVLFRALAKLKNGYVDALPSLINEKTHRIHTSFIQTGTETGRLSSRHPNLQNIPIRDENGREIRRAFLAVEGGRFISADYSQIELVILAHLSQDQELLSAFREGRDVHKQTASLIFSLPEEEVDEKQRRIAKTINFGVMYGMSSYRLSGELDISREEADRFIDTYFLKYKGVHKFIEETLIFAEKAGGVETMFGRFRPIYGINSRNKIEKKGAGRIAVNTRIQGTAADVVKMAMLRIAQRIQSESLKSKLILQVHDECIVEAPLNEVEKVKLLLKEEMESAVKLSIPLRVNVEEAAAWGDIH